MSVFSISLLRTRSINRKRWFVGAVFFVACALSQACGEDPPTNPPNKPQTGEAHYKVTFSSTWSAQTHPTNFPGSAHFSPLIGAAHNRKVVFWKEGELASPGIETMAETGGTSRLRREINDAIAADTAKTVLSGNGLRTSPDSVSFDFSVNSSHPWVTLVTMLAPSPDWFAGVSSLPLYENGSWKEKLSVPLVVYDAGTDSGTGFGSRNSDTNPKAPITKLTSDAADTDFREGKPKIGTFTFEKVKQ